MTVPETIEQPGRIRSLGRETFRSLRTRNFRLFFIGQLISNTGNWLTMVALTLLVFHLTDSGLLVGALAVGRRHDIDLHLIVVSAALFGVAMVGLALVPSVWVAFPVVALVGVSSVSYMTATTALVQVRSDPTMHGRVLALQSALLIGTTPVGGPLLGALADAWGARVPVFVGAVAALGAAGIGWRASTRESVTTTPRGP